jgi:hypothetical protein
MSDLPFTQPVPDPSRPEREPRKCRRHQWATDIFSEATHCFRCGKPKDHAVSRRSRNNRKRGTTDELAVAQIVGGRKIGPLGLPWDVEIEGYARLQCKVLDRWPSLAMVIQWLDAIPAAPELRGVTLADTPGSGFTKRRLIVFDLAEWASWHGRPGKP